MNFCDIFTPEESQMSSQNTVQYLQKTDPTKIIEDWIERQAMTSTSTFAGNSYQPFRQLHVEIVLVEG